MLGLLGEIANARAERPPNTVVSITFQVPPPSVDLRRPVIGAEAYTMLGLPGAKAIAEPFKELWSSVRGLQVPPASMVCHMPPSAADMSQCEEFEGSTANATTRPLFSAPHPHPVDGMRTGPTFVQFKELWGRSRSNFSSCAAASLWR